MVAYWLWTSQNLVVILLALNSQKVSSNFTDFEKVKNVVVTGLEQSKT